MAFSISLVIARALALVGGGEGFGDENLAEGFAQVAVHEADAALPAGTHFGDAAHIFAIEIEIGLDESGREVGRLGVHQVPAQIGLPIVDGAGSSNRCTSL